MGTETAIAWCNHTFNPWMGCEKISAGCKFCYAETLVAGRFKLPVWGPPKTTQRKRTSVSNWKQPLTWNRAAAKASTRKRVFCASLADVFEDHPGVVEWRKELFVLIEQTPHLDWQLLTKRPENLRKFLPPAWLAEPRPNVWLGTTAEDQQRADERLPHLLSVPAIVHFVSAEPLLEPLELARYMDHGCCEIHEHIGRGSCFYSIDWLIVGGESGPGARPFDVCWAEYLISECEDAGVACFVKQLGAAAYDHREAGRDTDEPHPQGAGYDPDCRLLLRDKAGADPEEWDETLRVQQFPEVRR